VEELENYVRRAKESLYFSGAKIDAHITTFLADQRDTCLALGRQESGRWQRVYLVGSGGSWASVETAKYLLDGVLVEPVEALASYDLIWRDPRGLDAQALAVFVSYSGETEDTVAALRYANERGARTVAIVAKPDSAMAVEADEVILYSSGAIFEVPIVALILLAAGMCEGTTDEAATTALLEGIDGLPAALQRALSAEEQVAEQRARDLLYANHLYVLGSGPLSPLAYKLAMSVVMENIRIGATYSDSSEWRHGPAEALERVRAPFIVLLGTDASRDMGMRAIEFCRGQGADVMVYDAADYGAIHPMLTPLVMNSQTQWFIVYSALLRGITDLDARVFMGQHVLATGGAGWP
jgi:fructoselysine 6-phosphate deglycase